MKTRLKEITLTTSSLIKHKKRCPIDQISIYDFSTNSITLSQIDSCDRIIFKDDLGSKKILKDKHPVKDLELLNGDILDSFSDRKEQLIYVDEVGERHHSQNDYFFNMRSAKIQIRHSFKDNYFLMWIKYSPKPGLWMHSSELYFYENQLVKKFESMSFHQFKMLIWSLTGEELFIE